MDSWNLFCSLSYNCPLLILPLKWSWIWSLGACSGGSIIVWYGPSVVWACSDLWRHKMFRAHLGFFPARALKCALSSRITGSFDWASLGDTVPFTRECTLAVLIDPGLLLLGLLCRQSYERDVCIYTHTWNYLGSSLCEYVFLYLNLYQCLQFQLRPTRLIPAFPLSQLSTPFSGKQQPSSH